jgi:hypothetical protein
MMMSYFHCTGEKVVSSLATEKTLVEDIFFVYEKMFFKSTLHRNISQCSRKYKHLDQEDVVFMPTQYT